MVVRCHVTWIISLVVRGPPKVLTKRFRRQLSHYEDLALHSVDGGAEDGEGSGDDQRGVHDAP
jgi:hypothetical protein